MDIAFILKGKKKLNIRRARAKSLLMKKMFKIIHVDSLYTDAQSALCYRDFFF